MRRAEAEAAAALAAPEPEAETMAAPVNADVAEADILTSPEE